MDLRSVAESVPSYTEFFTVDELRGSTRRLAADFPGIVRVRSIGQSRAGDNLELVTIGDGPRSALVVGTPHPNEPVGCLTIEFLLRHLCENAALLAELGFTWHFIKTIDPDGLRLNAGWLKAPRTPLNYTRAFFRPALADQAEYSFPMDYKILHWDVPTPETRAWMRVIDEVKPDLQFTLHNSDFGGVWHLVSEACPLLYPVFKEVADWCGIALDPVGEPGDFFRTYAPSVFARSYIQQLIDDLVMQGVTEPSAYWPGGAASADYARRYGTFELVVETPYWDNPVMHDQSESTEELGDLVEAFAEDSDRELDWLIAQLAPVQSRLRLKHTPLRNAVDEAVTLRKKRGNAPRGASAAGEERTRLATRAEAFLYRRAYPLFRQRLPAMSCRMLEEEIAHRNQDIAIVQARDAIRERLEANGQALEELLQYRIIPLRDLVIVQACAGLATAAYLRDRE